MAFDGRFDPDPPTDEKRHNGPPMDNRAQIRGRRVIADGAWTAFSAPIEGTGDQVVLLAEIGSR